MVSKNNYAELLEKVAKRMTLIANDSITEECPIGIIDVEEWEWPQGVGMYGLFKYYQQSGKKEYLDYMVDWYDRHIRDGLPDKNVNTMAPMLTLAHIYEFNNNEKYLEILTEWAEWVMNDMTRTEEGGLQHIVTGGTNEQQLWDDTLFMTVLFLAKFGSLTGQKQYIDESVRQFLLHIKYLHDKKTGLWFHGWTFIGRSNFAEALWARGNCWYTAGVVEYLDMVPVGEGVKKVLLDTLEAQVRKLTELQERDGMWHTLLDDPSSYVETSATAGFGFGILKAVRKGYLDKKYKKAGEKALEAVLDRIDENGTVQQVSYGTGMGHDLDHYRNIQICPMTYGQALALLILGEGMKL